MKRFCIFFLAFLLTCAQSFAQVDRREVRSGNRRFRKDSFKEAEIDYRKAVLKDSTSVAGQYNLASALYRQQDFDGAAQALSKVEIPDADVSFNSGDAALQKQDYASAVKAFREALLLNPADMDAKENYIYAKKKLEDQQNQQNQDQNQQNQDNQQNRDQDQNQQNQDNQQNQNPQDQNRDRDDSQSREQQPKISEQQAQQMLKAIQAKERETQDKVNKEKAALLQSRQKEKNW